MTPTWLNDIVRQFGRQMALERFELNDRGVAGVRFENGLTFRFEYAEGALIVSMGVSVPAEDAVMKKLLASVHPSARHSVRLRAAYLSRTREAIYTIRLAEREVTVTTLESVFRDLWSATDYLRRQTA